MSSRRVAHGGCCSCGPTSISRRSTRAPQRPRDGPAPRDRSRHPIRVTRGRRGSGRRTARRPRPLGVDARSRLGGVSGHAHRDPAAPPTSRRLTTRALAQRTSTPIGEARSRDPTVRLIPSWLRRYDRGWLPADATAGLTIWALMVPQAMAYAGIAGVPVQNGLYVMPLAVVGYALFGTSRHLFVGPSATVATLSASSVAVVATASTGSGEYVALTCALTLLVGVIYVAGGLA